MYLGVEQTFFLWLYTAVLLLIVKVSPPPPFFSFFLICRSPDRYPAGITLKKRHHHPHPPSKKTKKQTTTKEQQPIYDWFLWLSIGDEQVFVLCNLIIHTGKQKQTPKLQTLKCCACKTDYSPRKKTGHPQEQIQNPHVHHSPLYVRANSFCHRFHMSSVSVSQISTRVGVHRTHHWQL